ncbi:MAG: BTAD domain-containing putative transcriptional regulator [Dermatophilaceae bacterium]
MTEPLAVPVPGPETTTVAELRFTVLGPLEVRRGDLVLSLGGHQQRAVLACLLVEAGHAVAVDRIADGIWGEHLPSGYLTSLQTYVFHLREALEPHRAKGAPAEVLVTVPGGYRLDVPSGAVDAARFEEAVERGRGALESGNPQEAFVVLSEALALWRGDVLADLGDVPSVASQASRLTELRLAATEIWSQAGLELGRHASLVPELRRLTEAHPLREGLHAARMLALYRSGRQAEALEAYRQVRFLLDDELGVQPGAQLRTLQERILRQDPALTLDPVRAENGSSPVTSASELDQKSPAYPVERGEDGAPDVRAGEPAPRRRLSRRSWAAVVTVVLVCAGLLVGGLVIVTRRTAAGPVPPNTVAMLSNDGIEGETVPVGSGAVAMASGAGAVWVAEENGDELERIDAATHRIVQTIHGVGGSPRAVAMAGEDVWVTGSDDSVVTRVSAATNEIVDKIPVGIDPGAIVATPQDVWVANAGDNTVQRIDPSSGEAGQPILVGDGPDGLALDGTTLWIANSRSASVTRLDTRAGEAAAADIPVDAGPRGVTLTTSDVWIANELGQSVARIDRSTGRVVSIPVDDGPTSIVVTDGVAWVNNASSGSISRIDTATNAVTRTNLGSAPRSLTWADGHVWVATGSFGNSEHVGGTLTLTQFQPDLGSLDPSAEGGTAHAAPLRHVYDHLVDFRSSGGRSAETLVPDLTTSLPRPTDGGRTYVFTIRPNIRYSTGATVRASDFALGLRRALSNPQGLPENFRSVVGAASCIDHPGVPDVCDLTGGVSADDATGRLTIRLTTADPEFLYKLAGLLVPAPSGSPLNDVGMTAAIPGTGPYMVKTVAADGGFTLDRNPYFSQWSFAAQPAGYPDEITFRPATSADAAVADVIAGRADITRAFPPQLPGLNSHAGLLHRYDPHSADFAYLNSRIPPFDDVRVRRALNYAVDRRELVALYGGGEAVADLSCQLLPTAFPGWRRYCPYQVGPANGPYSGPDVDRTRQLVRDSGTKDVPISIHAWRAGPLYGRFPDYLAQVLRSIGYTSVDIVDIPPEHVPPDPHDPAYATYQLFTQAGWIADYPSPSTFYQFFSCNQPNMSGYCNKAVEDEASQALALEQSDPTRAMEQWALVDRSLTDDAAFVALGNQRATQVVSARVGNYQGRPGLGALISQLWVR